MKHLLFKLQSFLVLLVFTAASAYAQKSPVDMNRFIDDLMKKMTLEEKIGQLNLPVTGEITTGQAKSSNVAKRIRAGEVGGLFNLKGVERIRDVQKQAVEESRLGIPLLFGMDVIHGYETVFPIPLGLSCTWDMKAVEESARIAAIESSADGICWTFSPMVDICRDARWGRVSEGNGEDPFLGGAIAKAMVSGYQGVDLNNQLKRNDEIMACVKHFALYGAGEAGRDYNTVDMSRNRMFNEFMYPYEAAVEAGVGSVMASFNEIDGIPATGNKWLLSDLLRGQWGFEGFVVTDFTGISEMIEHGVGDLQTVSALALNAGVDMDMVSEGFVGTLMKSIKEGKVREVYDNGDSLIMVATDRISAFDHILKNKITDKGAILTQMSKFWFEFTKDVVPNHMISVDAKDMPEFFGQDRFNGNSMLCKKLEMLPIECIVRGYITGSGWASYQENGTVCGIRLPEGLVESDKLPEPIYTPSTKADLGDHDENISFEKSVEVLEKIYPEKGREYAEKIRDYTIALYKKCAEYALTKGIIIADTKFEFGLNEQGEVVLADEMLTPDSSRFWPLDGYKPGQGQPSFDKQYVRDWLKANPDNDLLLPDEVVVKTVEKYKEAFELLTGSKFSR